MSRRAARRSAGHGGRGWLAILPLVISSFLLMLQDTAAAVAQPAIGRGLGLGVSGLEWVVNGYTLALAVLMLPGARLADLFGRRRVFTLGLAVFSVGSLASGLAPSGGFLIASRVLQGAGSALMAPAALSLVSDSFSRRRRGTAIGVWAGVSSTALALGPLIGAVVDERLGWRWIFLGGVPLGLVAAALGILLLPAGSRPARGGSVDAAGVVLSAAALSMLVFALTEAGSYGWTSGLVLSLMAGAGAATAAFLVVERRVGSPLLDLALFRRLDFGGANLVTLLSTSVMCSVFFFISLYLQLVLGYTPIGAGAVFLPMTGLIFVGAPLAGRLADRVGSRVPAAAGMLLLAAGLGGLSRIGLEMPLWRILVSLAVVGLGIALTTTPTTAAGLEDGSGTMRAGVLNTSRMIGLALGIATMGAIVATRWPQGLVAGAASPRLFTSGLSLAFLVNAGIAVAGALVAAAMLPARRNAFDLIERLGVAPRSAGR